MNVIAEKPGTEAPVVVPPGSTAIEDVYESYYTLVREPYDDSGFDGRSDYQAFIEAGIPSGGLFTGAEEVKTAEQAAIWAARRACRSTRATTSPATTSPTSTSTRWT